MERLWTGLALALALALAATPARGADDGCVGEVCLLLNHNDAGVWFGAKNHSHAPVSLRIEIERPVNLDALPRLPAQVVIPPGQAGRVVQLVQRSPNAGWSFRSYRWQWWLGDPNAHHDDSYRYRMPFGGREPRVMSQGPGGRFSHNTPGSRFAFDFGMPIGTPILAARAGVVVDVADGYTDSGTEREFLWQSNSVTILHDDGTFASYGHLDPGSGVRPGMRVLTGDVIGFSGNTGFSTGPHLHFSVWKANPDRRVATLPIRFHGGGPDGFLPATGRRYGPGCHDEGLPCGPGDLPEEQRTRDPGYVSRSSDGTCRCPNGSVITTHLPCRMVCPKR